MSSLFTAGGQVITTYPTPDALEAKVDEYFDWCLAEVEDPKTGFPRVYEKHTPSYAGLARYLGFTSRLELLNYQDRDERYTNVIKVARLRLEEYLEGKLVHSKAPAGIALSLKNNAGWEEKSTRQLSGVDDKPLVIGWSTSATDVIDASASVISPENKGVLPPTVPQIESTSSYAVVDPMGTGLDGDD